MHLEKVEEQYMKLLKEDDNPIKENADVQIHFKWNKAVNDLSLSEGLFKISTKSEIKNAMGYPEDTSFFDWVIVSSYYSIFHAAQALLGLKKIKITKRLHYATLISFAKHYVINKELEEELFFIYEDAENQARELMEIFEEEKRKRGLFQYHRLSKSNLNPAKESLSNAKTFLNAIKEILKKNNII